MEAHLLGSEATGGFEEQTSTALSTLERAYGFQSSDHGAPCDPSPFGADFGRTFKVHHELGEGQWAFVPLSDGLNLTLTDLVYFTDSSLAMEMDEFVTISVILEGRRTWRSSRFGEVDLDRPHCTVAVQADGADIAVSSYGGVRQTAITLHCGRDFLDTMFRNESIAAPGAIRAFIEGGAREPWLHTISLSPAMIRTFRELAQAPYRNGLRRIHTEAKTLELAGLVFDGLTGPEAVADPQKLSARDIERLHHAREIMTAQFADPPTIARLSRELAINDYKLKRGFKQLFGTTLFDYCRAVRMGRAQDLLNDTDMPIGLIAETVGYEHASSFTTAFKAHFGYPPKRSRRLS